MTGRAPERWLVLRVPRPADEDRSALLADALVELGGRAVWEKDDCLVTHLPEPSDPEAFLAEARRALSESVAMPGDERSPVALEAEWQPHEDWAELWKRGLRPRRVTDRIVVTPSWLSVDSRPGDLVITVDPGMAFGNAEHGSTRGCLRLLDGCVRSGDRVLDVGAGSAILSLAAALLGCGEVLALEADPFALEPARENVEANGVASVVRVEEATVTNESLGLLEPRDGVVCNMEFGSLRPLLSGLVEATRPGGWLVLGGVLEHEWEELLELVTAGGVALEAEAVDEEWRAGLFRRA